MTSQDQTPGGRSFDPWAPRPSDPPRPGPRPLPPGHPGSLDPDPGPPPPPRPPPTPWAPAPDGPGGFPSQPPTTYPGPAYPPPVPGAAGSWPAAPGGPPSGYPPPAVPQPSGGGGSSSSGLGPALLGAIVGAIVAALVAGGLVLADRSDDDERSSATTEQEGPNNTLAGGELDIQGLLDRAGASVVSIQSGAGSAGSGVVISADGFVLTNNHVIEGATQVQVRFADGTTAPAELVGAFPDNDIAMVKAERAGLTPATLGSSSDLQVGDDVVAIGNALNLGSTPTVTRGIVSSLNRSIEIPGGGMLDDLIQTDAAINPGNSGGPLLNAQGEVVGINTAIVEGSQNIGFAIGIDAIKGDIERLQNGEGDVTGEDAFLGVSTVDADSPSLPPEVVDEFEITAEAGAVVVAVTPDSGAEAGGIQPGDVIVEIDGEAIEGSAEVGDIVRGKAPGDQLELVYERRGEQGNASITLGQR